MNKLCFIFACILFSLLFAGNTFAQVTITSTTTTNIVTPINIVKNQDMNFGNVAINATAGTVVLDPAGTRTATGGVTLPAIAGTVQEASFSISGENNYTYSIILPTSGVTVTNGTDNLTIDSFVSDPSTNGTLSASGSQTLKVGATLNLSGGQVAGLYSSPIPFQVTVNYN